MPKRIQAWRLEADRHGDKLPNSVIKPKAYNWVKPNTSSSLDYSLGRKIAYRKNLLLRKVLGRKVCELKENTFPNLREGDTPQGKARVSKLKILVKC